jgi:hypothetical protein
MKKAVHVVKHFIRANIIALGCIFVAYTMISFIYYYHHLKQDPMHFFGWWWSQIVSFKIMDYKYYILAFEIMLLIIGIFFVRTEKDHKTGHEEYK